MVAPYAVGHLKMGFYLEELGHRLTETERIPFYLTTTLDMSELDQSRLPGLSSLAEKSRRAGRVKKQQRILFILSNTPYSGHSANQGAWIRNLVKDYKYVPGRPLGEKNPKWLQDDYVKFIRFAEWKIAQAGRGVVGMITNHSYLNKPTFRRCAGTWCRHSTKFTCFICMAIHSNVRCAPTVARTETCSILVRALRSCFWSNAARRPVLANAYCTTLSCEQTRSQVPVAAHPRIRRHMLEMTRTETGVLFDSLAHRHRAWRVRIVCQAN